MNKLLSAVGVALSIASSAVAAADAGPVAELPEKPATDTLATTNALAAAEQQAADEEVAEMEEEEPAWFEAEVDMDLFSAYVWRNAVFNDELVFQPCVSFDFTRLEPFWIGGYAWQNWDMTSARSPIPKVMNETDFNVHLGATVWESESGDYSFDLEIGNDFFTYRRQEDCPNSYELYVKAAFNNPFVGLYGQYSQAYNPVSACYFELGLNKEVNLGELLESERDWLNRISFGADWNLSLASGKYFTNYLYGPIPGAYDPETDEREECDMAGGVGGTTIKGFAGYRVCEHFSLGIVLAYTALLSGDACDAMKYADYGNMYKRLFWCGLQAKVDF